MPGVAYLEMARAAVIQAIGGTDATPSSSRLRLSHVTWARPLVCDPAHPATVHITLSPQESGTIAFLISSEAVGTVQSSYSEQVPQGEEHTEQALVCQGTAELKEASSIIPGVDLPAIQGRTQQQISATEC